MSIIYSDSGHLQLFLQRFTNSKLPDILVSTTFMWQMWWHLCPPVPPLHFATASTPGERRRQTPCSQQSQSAARSQPDHDGTEEAVPARSLPRKLRGELGFVTRKRSSGWWPRTAVRECVLLRSHVLQEEEGGQCLARDSLQGK